MQIPCNSSDVFIKSMTEKGEKIRALFFDHITNLTKNSSFKIMLEDGTVSDRESFDPTLIRQFYGEILQRLHSWKSQGTTVTADKDLRRCFIKFEVIESKYILSCHMSIQYHALLFYKLDHRVIDIRKELLILTDKISKLQQKAKPESNRMIEEKLKQKGYENLNQEKLFEVLFDHDDVTHELVESLQHTESEIVELEKKRNSFFEELDNMLIELYQMTPVMIDEIRIMAGEEGCICNFNIESMKNGSRQGNFNPSRISSSVKDNLLMKMDDIIKVLNF